MDLCFAGIVLILAILAQPETFEPIFLEWKAKHLRVIANNRQFKTKRSLSKMPALSWFKNIFGSPLRITVTEPILILSTSWLVFIWVMIFSFLSGNEYIFRSIRFYGKSDWIVAPCFMGMAVGSMISFATVPLVTRRIKSDLRRYRQEGLSDAAPECRLWYSILSVPAVPISLLWMAWTDDESITIWAPLAASVFLGYGMAGVFTGSYEYIVHAYGSFSSRVLAFNSFTRYLFAAIAVGVAPSIWRNLGVQWTLMVMGCVATMLTPVPYILYIWGPSIRLRSQYACGLCRGVCRGE